MEGQNLIQNRSFNFALEIVTLCKNPKVKTDWVIVKQLLKSGTSIGANVEEAIGGQSKRDFISKMSIAYKEARETRYWLKLLKETGHKQKQEDFDILLNECEEICRILGKILSSSRANIVH